MGRVAWQSRPLSFLAQINLGDVAEVGCDLPLPTAGLLLFFYDAETQPCGFDPLDAPGCHVLFVNAETATERRASPDGGPSRVQPLKLHPYQGLQDPHWVYDQIKHDQRFAGYEPFYQELLKLSEQDDQEISFDGHALGGWPHLIQSPMELECEMVTHGIYAGDADGYADPRVAALKNNPMSRVINFDMALTLGCDEVAEFKH